MGEPNMTDDKSTWAVGGGVLLGVGAGFFFLEQSVFAFVGCIIGGLGFGLLVTALISAMTRGK